ncbi:MerR family DNA-binding protein [Paenibacillus mendelii]|uniref:MerR family DNA-binding protein n=1 Tax=Paenibacillus mendelii TaxID=206163 RepID=A0ABV6J593_9BACL|nr:MerR family DNA-binding protein [Paenibacillus mendelii]MCQ6560250.1 MerR family DNA-binding protein [Paenibacillus mendelii]
MRTLTVSQVAAASNVRMETVRYYERRGLITKPPRSESGYRMFTQVEDIQFIKRAQEIGFTLEEIRGILNLYKSEEFLPSKEMHQLAQAKVQEIDEKINRLQQFKALLEQVTTCPVSMMPLPKSQCPVIQKCKGG